MTGSEAVMPWLPEPELMTTGSTQPPMRASEPAAGSARAIVRTSLPSTFTRQAPTPQAVSARKALFGDARVALDLLVQYVLEQREVHGARILEHVGQRHGKRSLAAAVRGRLAGGIKRLAVFGDARDVRVAVLHLDDGFILARVGVHDDVQVVHAADQLHLAHALRQQLFVRSMSAGVAAVSTSSLRSLPPTSAPSTALVSMPFMSPWWVR